MTPSPPFWRVTNSVCLSSQCEATFLSYPDTNLHFLVLASAGLAFCLLGSPIFYGNSVCAELFNNFSSVWKLRNNDPVTKVISPDFLTSFHPFWTQVFPGS